MSKELYTWWAKYMFWKERGWPFVEPIPSETMLIIGHRGSAYTYPGNTILAFDKAIEEGAHGIECDVQKSSDGHYVIIHDATVDATTNYTGLVSSYTLAELTAMDAGGWKDPIYAGREDTKIPSLDQLLTRYGGEPVFLSLNIKIGYSDSLAIVDDLITRGLLGQCFIFTDRITVSTIKSVRPDAFVMNDELSGTLLEHLYQAKSANWNAISTAKALFTHEHVLAVNAEGIYTHASYISSNFAAETQALIDIGANFILGDDVASMVAVANTNGITQIVPGDI